MAANPQPEKLGRTFWVGVTAIIVGLALIIWWHILAQVGMVIGMLSPVLMPLAAAAILACILDPLVNQVEARLKIPRARAIILVFFLAVMLVLILLATVVPQLVIEARQLADSLPALIKSLHQRLTEALQDKHLGTVIQEYWDNELAAKVQEAIPAISGWLVAQVAKAAGWLGFALGLALVPVYTFYFLLEKKAIQQNWSHYLPLQESKVKEEAVFILTSFNGSLVAFFRGQVLVSLCMGAMLTTAYLVLGLNYAVLLGFMAALLGIIPYIGYIISVGLAVIVAIVQFGDPWHPLGIVGFFAAAQMFEGLYISPKIIGDRVGMHPVIVIVAILIGTTLMGGIIGGLMAIPLAAGLRTLLARYIWKRKQTQAQAPAAEAAT